MSYAARFLPASAVVVFLFTLPAISLALSIEGNVDLPGNCIIKDKNNVSHAFPKQDSPSTYLAVCALARALESGLLRSAQLSEFPGFGLFVEGLESVTAGGDEYWALWLNGGFADCGIECLPLTQGDTLAFILTSFEGQERGSRVVFHITSLLQTGATSPVSVGGMRRPPPTFDVAAALTFVGNKQHPDGSFGNDFVTDWAAIAVASADASGVREALRRYLLTYTPKLANITDYERHAMALMSLGIDPYVGTPTDYVTPIIAAFDGTQIGDALLVNDDIFALFPLLKAGFNNSDDIVGKTIAFIIMRQKPDGSWEESSDLTAAAIQALQPLSFVPDVSTTVAKAREYLHTTQETTGGWKNSFSTSWALQAIHTLDENLSAWTPGEYSPMNFLGLMQLSDGGLEPTSTDDATRIWATTYAIPAALGKSWNDILQSFPRAEKSVAVKAIAGSIVAGAATSAVETTRINEPFASTSQENMLATSTSQKNVTLVTPTFRQNLPPPSPTEKLPLDFPIAPKIPSSSQDASQVALAREAIATETKRSDATWMWPAGFVVIFGAAFYLLQRF